jgi:Flp pilus assembly protein TadG
MKFTDRIPVLSRLMKEDKGQALVFTAVVLTAFMGVTGIAVDAGKGYYAWELLKSSTDAAALAGAAGMPNTTTAGTYANAYGSKNAAWNANGIMNTVVETVSFKCLTTVTNTFYAPCENSTGGGSGTTYNAVQVNQTAKVPTWIGPLFGMPTFNINATATASMKGGEATPYNIAVILDTTSSMTGSDDGANNTSNCNTQIACAELGIQTLLLELYPCQGSGTCSTSSTPIDNVALFVFPGATSTTITDDYGCGGKNPTIVPYEWQNVTPGSQNLNLPTGDTYQVVPFDIAYKLTNAATTLNPASDLVMAVGGVSGCGAAAPGGEGTYYAQVIYAAQTALATEKAANGFSNMMIILSDGDATACNTTLATAGGTKTTNSCGTGKPDQITAATGNLNGTGTAIGNPLKPAGCSGSNPAITCNGYLSANYPSALGECGQAVVAAQYAASQGTTVYAVGYGTEASGCTTDSSYSDTVAAGSYGGGNWQAGDSPCQAMAAMSSATNGSTFFSDQVNGCDSTDTNNVGITSLKAIFERVGADISSARLIPNTTT